jgi:hypothetical protein
MKYGDTLIFDSTTTPHAAIESKNIETNMYAQKIHVNARNQI